MKTQPLKIRRRRFLQNTAVLTSGVLMAPIPAASTIESCADLFRELEDFVNGHAHEGIDIRMEGVRIKKADLPPQNRQQNNVVSYFFGHLTYNRQSRFFQCDLTQYFSDRRKNDQPFDREKTDVLGVRFFSNGRLQFILKSWGNHSRTFQPMCSNGILHGYDPDNGYWAVQFVKTVYPL